MVILGLLLAFTLPQITGSSTANAEQQGKMTINAAMDSITAAYSRSVVSKEWDSSVSPAVPPGPDVDAETVRVQAPDVRVTDSPTTPGSQPNQVSVGSKLVSPAAGGTPWWRVGAAVVVPSGSGAGSCWLMWRNFDPPVGTPLENYMVVDMADANDTRYCTGAVAAGLEWVAPPPSAPPATGRNWSTPRSVAANGTELPAAAAS